MEDGVLSGAAAEGGAIGGDSDILYNGRICRLNSKYRSGHIEATSQLPHGVQQNRFFFRCAGQHTEYFERLHVSQNVMFRIQRGREDHLVVSQLLLIDGHAQIDIPIVLPESRTHQYEHAHNTARKHERTQRRNGRLQEQPDASPQPRNNRPKASGNPRQPKENIPTMPSENIEPSLSPDDQQNDTGKKLFLAPKHSALTGVVVAVKNLDTDRPYGFIQSDDDFVDVGRHTGVKFDFSNVKPAGMKLMQGDRVKFVLQARNQERRYATRVYIQSLSAERSSADIEYLLEQILSKCNISQDPNNIPNRSQQADFLINILGGREIWKCVGDSQNLSKKAIIHLIDLVNKVKTFSTGLTTNFTSIVQTLAHTNLLNTHNGPLVGLIHDGISNGDQELLVHIRTFLLLIADNVPEKIAAVSSLVKPMVSVERTSVDFFLWRVLKASVRSKDAITEDQEWSELPLVPSPHEMLHGPQEGAFNLQAAKTHGAYKSAEEYMDTNFRLLRADCFNALNKGVRSLIQGNLDHRDMNAYHGLRLHGLRISDYDSPVTLALNITPLRPVKNWEKARNLMYGNLVCISVSGTFQDPIWGTVTSRDLLQTSNIVMLELCSESNTIDDAKAIEMLHYADRRSVMVESPTYYRAYQPALRSLQCIAAEDIPFQQELIDGCRSEKPSFYTESSTLDGGVIYGDSSSSSSSSSEVAVEDFCSGAADGQKTTLDASQEDAVRQSLLKRVAIIQGPPGTGKTFIGAKLVQLINTVSTKPQTPILVLTYKNHALDEFMKEMSKQYPGDIARIGGRATALSQYNLTELKKQTRKSPALYDQLKEYRSEMEQLEEGLRTSSQEMKSKMQLNLFIFLTWATSAQLENLLTKCDWLRLRVPSMYREPIAPDEFHQVKKKKNQIVDNREIYAILQNINQPVKDYISSSDDYSHTKPMLLKLLEEALDSWLPTLDDFDEVRGSLYTTPSADLSKLATRTTEEESEDLTTEDDAREEEIKAEEEERMAATGALRGEKVTMENLITLVENRPKGFKWSPSIFPVPKELSSNVFRTYIMQKNDLWSMSKRERVLFVQNILHMEFGTSQTQFNEGLTQYKNLHKCKAELEILHSVDILQKKKVVGMTITGASIHCDLIAQLKPQVVLVEEAAEVMEPQLLSCLGKWVEQIILIGDQQQLRPTVESFEMRKFHLDVSLMERLINNDLYVSKLQLQNRMRPEFAEMLTDIYPGLQSNLQRVGNNTKPQAASKAMYFWTHNFPEVGPAKEGLVTAKNKSKDVPSLGRSYRNDEEAERCIRLALFFIQQGHLPCHITILAAYLGQVHLLRSKMREARKIHEGLFSTHCSSRGDDDFDPNRVVIQTIDNYQGDENEIVLISLVRSNDNGKTGFLNTLNRRCVAQSRAKCGMYFVGNDSTIRASRYWQPLLQDLRERDCLGVGIPLQCPRHTDAKLTPRNASDITLQPFCTTTCGEEMPCGNHTCDQLCQPAHSHAKCTNMVQFKFERCGHLGVRQCCENEYEIKCQLEVDFTFPCSHTTTKKCFENGELMHCQQEVSHRFECGHTTKKKCFLNIKYIKCKATVMFDFPCGHVGSKTCGENEALKICEETVSFTFPCGHSGVKGCTEDGSLKQCAQNVEFALACGHPGKRKCYESEETIQCGERCTKLLPKCGHICSGICSKPCDQNACQECRRIAKALEEKQRQEEERKREEIRKQVDVEIACIKTNMQPFFLTPLAEGGPSEIEYLKVHDMVLKYIQPMHNWYPKITRIEKIHNSSLYLQFLQRKRSLFDPSVCQEKFHGASAEMTRKIVKYGFELPKRGSQFYGNGLYFTSDSSASAQDAYTQGSGTLLLCDVLLGRSLVTKETLKNMTGAKLNKGKYDSVFVKSGTAASIMNDSFIVYKPDQALPKYVIHYVKHKVEIRPLETLQLDNNKQLVKYEVHHIKSRREVDFKDALDLHFRIVESQFHRLRGKYTQLELPDIESIEYHINPTLVEKFEAKEKEFETRYKQTKHAKSVLVFHGTSPENIHGIVQNNFDMTRIERAIHGFGVYFSEFPAISTAYGEGLLMCKVLSGKSYEEKNERVKQIPDGFDSILVKPDDQGRGKMLVIANPDQILPCYVIHLQKPTSVRPNASASNQTPLNPVPSASPSNGACHQTLFSDSADAANQRLNDSCTVSETDHSDSATSKSEPEEQHLVRGSASNQQTPEAQTIPDDFTANKTTEDQTNPDDSIANKTTEDQTKPDDSIANQNTGEQTKPDDSIANKTTEDQTKSDDSTANKTTEDQTNPDDSDRAKMQGINIF